MMAMFAPMTSVMARGLVPIRTTMRPVDDGVFCNGADSCDGGACVIHAGDPCSGGTECSDSCNESADNCFDLSGGGCSDDGNVCTDDVCDGAGTCTHPNNSASCDDGVFCNGPDTCLLGACSIHDGDPCTGGGQCNDLCNEGAGNCADSAGTVCDDGSVCTVNDQCDGNGACSAGTPLNCDDGDFCTDDSCDVQNGCQNVFNGNQGCNPIYVSPSGTGNGTAASPASLLNGLSLIQSGETLIMATGTYSISSPITTIPSDITMSGGHDPLSGWAKTGGPASTVIARNSANPQGSSHRQRLVAIQMNGVSNVQLDNFRVTTSSGTGNGMSTYGIHMTSGADWHFVNLQVLPGNAAKGANGATGATGSNGGTGANGLAGDEDDEADPGHGGVGGVGGGSGGGSGGAGGFDSNGGGCCTAGSNGGTGGTAGNFRAGGGGGGGASGGEEKQPWRQWWQWRC